MRVLTQQGSDMPAWLSVVTALGAQLSDVHMVIQIGIGLGALTLIWLRVWDRWKGKMDSKKDDE